MTRKLYKLVYLTDEYLKEHNRFNDFIIKFETTDDVKAEIIAEKILADLVWAWWTNEKKPSEPLPNIDDDFPHSAIDSLYCIEEDWRGHDMTFEEV